MLGIVADSDVDAGFECGMLDGVPEVTSQRAVAAVSSEKCLDLAE